MTLNISSSTVHNGLFVFFGGGLFHSVSGVAIINQDIQVFYVIFFFNFFYLFFYCFVFIVIAYLFIDL